MKKKIFAVLYIVCSGILHAQGTDADFNLQDLQAPNTPAFILLDVAPTSIERPATLKAFTASISNSFSKSYGIPQNYGVEITPFWFIKQENMTVGKFWGLDLKKDSKHANHPFGNAKFVTLSLAFINQSAVDSITLPANNNIVIGGKTTLIKVYRPKHIQLMKDAKDSIQNALEIVSDKLPPNYTQKDLDSAVSKYMAGAHKNMMQVLALRPLFALDIATATSISFDELKFSSVGIGRVGAWATFNFSFPLNKTAKPKYPSFLNLIGTSRYTYDKYMRDSVTATKIERHFVDFGAKIEFEFWKLALSTEFINRIEASNVSGSPTPRWTGQVKYKIKDGLFATATVGKNFGDQQNLITFLGLNWGFNVGSEKVKAKD